MMESLMRIEEFINGSAKIGKPLPSGKRGEFEICNYQNPALGLFFIISLVGICAGGKVFELQEVFGPQRF